MPLPLINITTAKLFSQAILTPTPAHNQAMTTIPNSTTPFHHQLTASRGRGHHIPRIQATLSDQENPTARRKILTTLLTTTLALGLQSTPLALAQNWGTRSFMRERFFEPGLSPEDSVERIRQTAQGLHDLRGMLETMSWRYVIFYIRLKQAYLSQDMKAAMSMVPESRRKSYVEAANDLVDNMAEFDYYVRSPKVYESYLYYEKTLKSIDNLVALLA